MATDCQDQARTWAAEKSRRMQIPTMAQVLEDRRLGSCQRPPHQGRHCVGLSDAAVSGLAPIRLTAQPTLCRPERYRSGQQTASPLWSTGTPEKFRIAGIDPIRQRAPGERICPGARHPSCNDAVRLASENMRGLMTARSPNDTYVR
jgi:hypothetical protein